MGRTVGIGVTSITMPRELVEEEEEVLVVAHRVEPDPATGMALAPAPVRVARHQPLAAMGMPVLKVMVRVVAKVPVLMGLAEKDLERAAEKDTVRVA